MVAVGRAARSCPASLNNGIYKHGGRVKHLNHHGGTAAKRCGFCGKLDIYRVVAFDLLSSDRNGTFVCSLRFSWRKKRHKQGEDLCCCHLLWWGFFFCFVLFFPGKTDGEDLLDRSGPTTLESGLLEKKWHLNLFWCAWQVVEGSLLSITAERLRWMSREKKL